MTETDKPNSELTKAQVLEKLELVEQENDLLKSAGNHDLSWYGKEIERKDRQIEELSATIKGWESRKHEQERENAVKLADAAREEEDRKKQFNITKQSEHTRFRVSDHPYQRDIFGDTVYPVFDLAIELQHYSGPVQIPVHFIQEMAESIGMLPIEETIKLRQELADSTAKNEIAATLGTELTSGISVLVDKFYADLADITGSVVVADETKSEELGESNDDSSNSDENSGQADDANSDKNSDGVSGSTGNANDGDDPEFSKLLKF